MKRIINEIELLQIKYKKIMDNFYSVNFKKKMNLESYDLREIKGELDVEEKFVIAQINNRILSNDKHSDLDFSEVQKDIEIFVLFLIPVETKKPYFDQNAGDILKSIIFYTLDYNYYLDKDDITFVNIIDNISKYYLSCENEHYIFKDILTDLQRDYWGRKIHPIDQGKIFETSLGVLKNKLDILQD